VADCDLRIGLRAKRWFDAIGHYGREDVLPGLVAGSVENGVPAPSGTPEPVDGEGAPRS
jgi:hypothetical protein